MQYTGKNAEILVEKETLFLKQDVPQHRKDRNSSQKVPQILFHARTTTPNR